MTRSEHSYRSTARWQGGREGAGEVLPASGPVIPVAVPTELDGPGGATNPEELLTSALAACYTMALGIITKNRGLPVLEIRTEAVGRVEQEGLNFRYVGLTLRPVVTVSGSATEEEVAQVEQFAHKAERYCIIAAAVRGKVEIVVEPKVVVTSVKERA